MTCPLHPACPQRLQETNFILKHRLNSLSFCTLIFHSETHLAQHPAFDSSLQGMPKEKHGNGANRWSPQHILPSSTGFPCCRKEFLFYPNLLQDGCPSTGNSYASCVAPQQTLPSREGSPLPALLDAPLAMGLLSTDPLEAPGDTRAPGSQSDLLPSDRQPRA